MTVVPARRIARVTGPVGPPARAALSTTLVSTRHSSTGLALTVTSGPGPRIPSASCAIRASLVTWPASERSLTSATAGTPSRGRDLRAG